MPLLLLLVLGSAILYGVSQSKKTSTPTNIHNIDSYTTKSSTGLRYFKPDVAQSIFNKMMKYGYTNTTEDNSDTATAQIAGLPNNDAHYSIAAWALAQNMVTSGGKIDANGNPIVPKSRTILIPISMAWDDQVKNPNFPLIVATSPKNLIAFKDSNIYAVLANSGQLVEPNQ